MGNLLYLVHRLPYPPNKGDKVRSYHLLKHLARTHRVFLGTFVDDPADEAYVDTVRGLCTELMVARLHPRQAKVRSLTGLLTHQALSLQYYRHAGLQAWVREVLATQAVDAVVVFSSVMAQYVDHLDTPNAPPLLVDFVDVDSAKWTQYADQHRWPMSWLYRREGERLLAYEESVAFRARQSFFVTPQETALFARLAPACASRVQSLSNGVEADFFAPDATLASPFAADSVQGSAPPLVFTGAMDYWPNIDAVTWFVQEMLPALRQAWPGLRFYIVGRSPTPAVLALASECVVVTGTVPDVRPYLQHAAVVVAPLRVARGVQNKILEAMAMARPVVAAKACVDVIDALAGDELLAAHTAEDFVAHILDLLRAPERGERIGRAARERVLARYSWTAHLAGIDPYLTSGVTP